MDCEIIAVSHTSIIYNEMEDIMKFLHICNFTHVHTNVCVMDSDIECISYFIATKKL